MFDSILVVCVGNICRSPTGEALLKKELPEMNISSAGIKAIVDRGASRSAMEIAEVKGTSLETHISRQLTSSLCRSNDLILVMEKWQIEAVCEIAPEVRGKTMLFGHWADMQEVPDPYKKSREVFEFVYDRLESLSRLWTERLRK